MSRTIWITAGALLATFAATQANAQAAVYVSQPPTVLVVPAPQPVRTWVPAHWEGAGRQRVWVEGHWVVTQPQHARGHGHGNAWGRDARLARNDLDRDGVPNRYDRDRDGDGVPNRYDRAPDNPRWR